MKTISDYDFARLSSFLDGELSRKEVNALIAEMESKPELKNLYLAKYYHNIKKILAID